MNQFMSLLQCIFNTKKKDIYLLCESSVSRRRNEIRITYISLGNSPSLMFYVMDLELISDPVRNITFHYCSGLVHGKCDNDDNELF